MVFVMATCKHTYGYLSIYMAVCMAIYMYTNMIIDLCIYTALSIHLHMAIMLIVYGRLLGYYV